VDLCNFCYINYPTGFWLSAARTVVAILSGSGSLQAPALVPHLVSSTISQTGLNMDIDLIVPIDSVISAASTDLTDPAPTMERSGSNDSRKSLSGEDLILHVSRMVKNRARPELIILELMEEYNFSFTEFKQLLRGVSI